MAELKLITAGSGLSTFTLLFETRMPVRPSTRVVLSMETDGFWHDTKEVINTFYVEND